MDTSDEYKSLWTISAVHSPPLLLSPTTTKQIGPLIFNPSLKPRAHDLLFTLPSISPQIPPSFSNASLSNFLSTSSAILPSTATSIASQLTSNLSIPDRLVTHNSLQLLRCPGLNSTLVFFPTGSNSDEIGFLILYVENSRLNVRGDSGENEVFTVNNVASHRIVKMLVRPIDDYEFISGVSTLGYLLVCTTYSVHYYKITMEYTDKITPQLELVGKMNFKSSAVIHASWSPHVPEHSLVLLESGDLYLFDLGFSFEPSISSPTLSRKKLKVVWDDSVISNKGCWLSCDFSYHPQILIVVHSMMVFLVDSSPVNSPFLKHVITPLLKPEGNDTFLAFSIAAAPDHFFFTVATNHSVFLCDIRKPMTPVLRWKHNVAQPSCILVSSLSTLRSHSEDVTYNSASEAGFGILLGSFLNGEFSLFCYGPHVRESVSSSFYAWGLPSDLSLLTDECTCGTCLLKEEFVKDRLPNWVNWQQKKESILGFGILDSNISSQLYDPDMYGGFTLITLTSSGYLEIHRYCASWDYSKTLRKGHYQQPLCLIDSNLCEKGEEGYNYKFKKTFQYLKLDFLWGYLKSDLAQIVSNELVKNSEHEIQEKVIYTREFHEKICQKVNMFGSSRALSVHDVYNDVSSPTSIHEVALRRIWANLPKNLLRFAFANYSDLARELKNVPFEFLEVPCMQPHLPPFLFRDPSSRSSKWSDKQKPTDSLVGPVIPLPLLITFHEDHMQKEEDNVPAAADSEINVECSRVMRVANQVTSQSCEGDPMDDKEDVFDGSKQPFASYKIKNDSVIDDDSNHTKMLFKVGEKDVVNEIFDSNCPVQLRFNKPLKSFGSNELNAYKLLKAQCTNFKQGCSSYQDYLTKSNIK